jgi:multiple sugar transport system permease protein
MVIFDVPAELITAFLMALLLDVRIRGQTIYRSLYILPAFMPLVPVAVLWMWMFDSNYGVVNSVLAFLHIPQPIWLADPNWSKPTLILLNLWTVGTTTIIFLAALQGVPEQLYEAAALDGAGRLRRLWHVTLPMISGATFFNLMVTMIEVFQIFVTAFLLGGSGGASSNTMVGNPQGSLLFYVLYLWDSAFAYLRFGYASAMAWLLFLIIMACTAVLLFGSRRWVYYEAGGS